MNLIPISVLIRVSIATQKGKGSFHLTTLGSQTTEGNKGKNLGAGNEAGAMKNVAYCFVPHGLSSLLSFFFFIFTFNYIYSFSRVYVHICVGTLVPLTQVQVRG